jgi:hypothetical protein
VDGLLIIATIVIIPFVILLILYSTEAQGKFEKQLTEFAKIHNLTLAPTDDGPRLFGSLGGRSLTIETFRPNPRYNSRHIRILLSTNAPGHVYLHVKGRAYLFHTWDPETETTPSLDILFEGESHPPDFITTLAAADPLLGYKLGRAVKQIGNYPFPLVEVKAGQVSLIHNQLKMDLAQLEAIVTALDRFASAIELAI